MRKLAAPENAKDVSYDDKTHVYRICGSKVLSVTQVIRLSGMSPYGFGEPGNPTPRMRVGTWIHDMLKLHFRGDLAEESLSPPMLMILHRVKDLVRDHGIEPFGGEEPLVHSTYWYGGKPDFIGYRNSTGRFCVLDWKWGDVSPVRAASDRVQLGGYAELVENAHGIGPVDVAPVYLKALVDPGSGWSITGAGIQWLRTKEIFEARTLFLAANSVLRWRIANGLLKTDEVPAEDDSE